MSLMVFPPALSSFKYLGESSSYLATSFLNSQTVAFEYIDIAMLLLLVEALFLTVIFSSNSPFSKALCG
jgi:hypothetical protein